MSAVGWLDRRALLQEPVDESELVALALQVGRHDVAIDELDVRVTSSGVGRVGYSLDSARKLLVW